MKEAGNFDYHVYVKAEGGATEDVAKGTINRFSNQSVNIHADNLSGWKYLYLETSNGTDGTNTSDHVDWANAYLVFQDQNSTRPCIVSAEELTTKLACATTVFSQPNVRFMQMPKQPLPDVRPPAAAVAVEEAAEASPHLAIRYL